MIQKAASSVSPRVNSQGKGQPISFEDSGESVTLDEIRRELVVGLQELRDWRRRASATTKMFRAKEISEVVLLALETGI